MSHIAVSPEQIKSIWNQACNQLKTELSPAVYNTWIIANPLTSLVYTSETTAEAIITSPTAFHASNLKKNLHSTIKNSLDLLTNRSCELSYRVGLAEPSQDSIGDFSNTSQLLSAPSKNQKLHFEEVNHTNSPRVEDLFSEAAIKSAHLDQIEVIKRRIGLRPDYNFKTFAVSTTNEMAHAAAIAVAKNPGTSYNPLFLYGGVGVGKTHLMHAIGNTVLSKESNVKIIYCSGEEFTNEIVQAIRLKKANQFKTKYRSADMLLIDDIQFIAGKNAVQEEFFHTFNALIQQHKQIILTSDKPPHDIRLLEDRLKSRFEAGLMIDIQDPSFELRTAIVLVKANASGLSIPIELAKMIAQQVTSARKIEGVITSIKSEVELKHRLITPQLITDVLMPMSKSQLGEAPQFLMVAPNKVIKMVASYYKLKQSALKGKKRTKHLVTARHIAMFLLKENLNLPLVEIGRWFANRDHTSVIHAEKKIIQLLEVDNKIKNDIAALRSKLQTL